MGLHGPDGTAGSRAHRNRGCGRTRRDWRYCHGRHSRAVIHPEFRHARRKDSRGIFSLAASPGPMWEIGILRGGSPLEWASPREGRNPVLTARDITDVKAEFVADPFMIRN